MVLSRGAFLVAVLTFLGGLLAGCGSGAPPDNVYQGTYRATYSVPQLNESGTFSFSVEKKGGMTGSFVDTQSNRTRGFRGSLNNSGNFSGDVTEDGQTVGSVSGNLSLTSGAGVVPGGDFVLSLNNRAEYRGSFTLVGNVDELPTFTSAYQGAFNGAYLLPGAPAGRSTSGAVSFTVDARGNVIGTFIEADTDKNPGNNPAGTLTGTVTNDGRLQGTVAFPARTGVAAANLPIEGTLVNAGNGKAQGNFAFVENGARFGGTFQEPTAPPGNSPFANAYRGTYSLPGVGESGTVSFTVEPTGTMTGFFAQSNGAPTGTIVNGTISNDGTFEADIQYPASRRRIVGALAQSRLSTGGLAGDFVITPLNVDGTPVPNAQLIPGNFEITIGGPEPDSIYRGAYGRSSAPEVSGVNVDSGAAPFAINDDLRLVVDKEGHMIGTLGGQQFSGNITNDGRFTATWGTVPVVGKISRQQIIILDPSDPSKRSFTEGISGTFTYTANGIASSASFRGTGGNTEGAEPR